MPCENTETLPAEGSAAILSKSPGRHTDGLHCPSCKTEVSIRIDGRQDVTCRLCRSTVRLRAKEPMAASTPVKLPPIGKFELLARLVRRDGGTAAG